MSKKILIVDDDTGIMVALKFLLEQNGYDTLIAFSGEDAMEVVERHHPDLILCDITMPGMDGLQVLEQIRANPATAAIPFVFLTARAEGELREILKRAGADDYLAKPFTLEQLHGVIERNLPES